MIVEIFKSWLKQNYQRFSNCGLSFVDTFEQSSIDGNDGSVVITDENSLYITQITVRNDGFINVEVLSNDTEEMVFYAYCKTTEKVDFDALMKNYFDFIM